MGSSSETESESRGFQNPDWETEFNLFEDSISSGSAPIRVRSIIKLSDLATRVPDSYIPRAIPILAGLLRVSDDPNRSVQAAAAHCLKRIACHGGEDGGFAVTMGRCGVIASLLGLLLEVNSNNNGNVFRRIWVKCLWSLVTFGSSIRVGLARLGGLEIVIRELNNWEDDGSRWYLLEILSALTTIRESRRVLVHSGGLKFLVEAAKVGNLASRERACHAIGLIGVTRRARRMLVEAGVIQALVDLYRDGDNKAKLLAGNALGIISAQTEYIRPVTEAGSIPLYVELLSGQDPLGKDIAEDVFCILAVAEGNAVLIAEQLVRILREGDNEAKLAASDVLWDLAGYRHSVSVIRESGAIPLLIELLRDGSLEFRERISGAISQLSYNENDREAFSDSGMIPILIEWLGDESEELRDNAAEALINFSEDQDHYARVREAISHPVFQSMQSRLARIRASHELMARSMRRVTLEHLARDPDRL
ncbi:PREDICTED: U-box domain-containing protein 4-like [Camelina sativa]|uniref:U-box domain-containing protein 4-like n=1 Tax=Camelina sativa TaxID=90675 RepID=A0ABM0W626_CAMSA|nr:PREDICTED: U-box domain-containing protein 4-like [Camelina sativa]